MQVETNTYAPREGFKNNRGGRGGRGDRGDRGDRGGRSHGDRYMSRRGTQSGRGTQSSRGTYSSRGTQSSRGMQSSRGRRSFQYQSNYWNTDLVKYLAESLAPPNQKVPFVPFNQNSEQVVVDTYGQIVTDGYKRLPDYLVQKWNTDPDWTESCYIYQVDTIYSLWHSILALIYPEYVLLDFDRRRVAVMRFREVVNNDYINNATIRNQIKAAGLCLAHVDNSIQQEKIQDEILLRFLSLYFDMNIYLITDQELIFYHWEPRWNPYKSGILLYRYPFGNIAPVFQGQAPRTAPVKSGNLPPRPSDSGILSYATSPEFIQPLVTKKGINLEEFDPEPQSAATVSGPGPGPGPTVPCPGPTVPGPGPAGTKVTTPSTIPVPTVPVRTVPFAPSPIAPPALVPSADVDGERKAFESSLKKLKWAELAALAQQENVNSMQSSARGGMKKKTKAQLIEDLWSAASKI